MYSEKIAVSIIVPIYNIQDYVVYCINSIIQQTFTGKIEAILIDDCCKDNSTFVIRHLISQYKGNITFKIIQHECNKGLSAARNTGIEHATGNYIYFLDGDDYIYPDCIEKLVGSIEQEQDIEYAIGNYTYDSTMLFPKLNLKSGIYKEKVIELYTNNEYYMMAWNKLYRKEFLDKYNLRFKDGLLHEDELWSFQCACHTKKISVVQENTYYYRVRQGSIQTSTQFATHHQHYCTSCLAMIEYIFKNDLSKNKTIFDYINQRIKWLFIAPFFEKQIELAKVFYQRLRKAQYWSLKDICLLTGNDFKRILLHIHRYLPINVGYIYFKNLFLRFYDK